MADILVLRPSLRADPKVARVGELLNCDPDLVVGKLVNLWGHVQAVGEAGFLPYAGRHTVDGIVGLPGFADALIRVNWLDVRLDGAAVLGYEQYLGVEGTRKLVNAWVKAHPPPQGRRAHPDDPGFVDFWSEYPKKVAQKEALAAWRRLAPCEAMRRRMMDALRLDRRGRQWTEAGGRFIPHAATWLNQERWTDERAAPGAAECGRVVAPAGKYGHLSGAAAAAGAAAGDPGPQGPGPGPDRGPFAEDD